LATGFEGCAYSFRALSKIPWQHRDALFRGPARQPHARGPFGVDVWGHLLLAPLLDPPRRDLVELQLAELGDQISVEHGAVVAARRRFPLATLAALRSAVREPRLRRVAEVTSNGRR
jgi:hypothetical protein